ncbi:hypothetical protein DERP_006304 [Dermatophagoides pteronyssinus]|uniref:Uncharacterized protein n=1 Tax=Dermatophagoides pteronyssinus TaxID=6956 RepID=A0ABQ8IYE6_DERPT|nr:hypothetical protein DERP_006304 [Dermatophagoides pteronyssinus]
MNEYCTQHTNSVNLRNLNNNDDEKRLPKTIKKLFGFHFSMTSNMKNWPTQVLKIFFVSPQFSNE